MGLVDRIVAGAERRDWTLKEPPDWLWDAWGGGSRSYSGKRVNVDNALGLIPVYCCVTLLSSAVAQCPLIVYRGEGGSRERARNVPQWGLLHDGPNDEQAPDVFLENVTGHENLWGNFYAEKVKARQGGRVVVGELWPLVPSKVRVDRDSNKVKVFEVEGNPRSFTAREILHIPAFGYDGLTGLSPIAQCRQSLGSMLARQEFEGDFYGNGAVFPGVLQMQGMLNSDDAIERLRLQWAERYGGAKNRHKPVILEQGMTWQSVGMPMKDMQFVESEKLTVNQTARMFQIPPEMVGGDREQSLTYSNVESQALHFVKFSLGRWLKRIEEGLRFDPDLFPPGLDLYPEFLVEGLLRADSAGRAEFYTAMAAVEAILINEIREKENLPMLPDGERVPMIPGKAPRGDAAAVSSPENGNGAGARDLTRDELIALHEANLPDLTPIAARDGGERPRGPRPRSARRSAGPRTPRLRIRQDRGP